MPAPRASRSEGPLGPPSDDEVASCLGDALRSHGETVDVVGLVRAPYEYATSFPLEDVRAQLGDGRVLRLILKDLTWERLLGDARTTKPAFLYEPRRPIETYLRLLAGTGVGVTCHAVFLDDVQRRYWMLLEKVDGVELWQVGGVTAWASVARWLAGFHLRFEADRGTLLERNPYLIRYDDMFGVWPRRAVDAAAGRGVDDETLHRLERIARRYDEVVERLRAVVPTLVHGELYPSNVLVDDRVDPPRVWPVDWEMAGVGPAYLDLVALTAGWDRETQAELTEAYLDALGPAPWRREGGDLAELLDCCRLHYALQWLGWAPGWTPPAEHARDWAEEARVVAERLGL